MAERKPKTHYFNEKYSDQEILDKVKEIVENTINEADAFVRDGHADELGGLAKLQSFYYRGFNKIAKVIRNTDFMHTV